MVLVMVLRDVPSFNDRGACCGACVYVHLREDKLPRASVYLCSVCLIGVSDG